MRTLAMHSPVILCLLTTLIVAVGSLLPVSPAQPLVLAAAAVAPPGLRLALVLLTTIAAMSAKTLLYLIGRGAPRRIPERHRQRLADLRVRLAGKPWLRRIVIVVSGATGLPPFTIITAVSGTVGWPLGDYVVCGTAGHALRFAALVFLPQLLRASR